MLSSQNKRIQYTGNGTTTIFAYNFRVDDSSWINVYVNENLVTNYSVSGVGLDAGGNITFTVAPVSGTLVTIIRNVPKTQSLDLIRNAGFPADSMELELDKLTMMVLDLQEKVDRSIKLPVSDTNLDSGLDIVSVRKNGALGFDNTGNITYYTVPDSPLASDSFLASGAGAVARTYQDKNRDIVSVKDFGAVGDGTTDDTSAIQAALNSNPTLLIFPKGTYKVGILDIKANIEIMGMGSSLKSTTTGIFRCQQALDRVHIYGFKDTTWNTTTGTVGNMWFWNNDQAAGTTGYTFTAEYAITDLQIHNNGIGAGKIFVTGSTTIPRIYRNHIVTNNSVSVSPSYIIVSKGNDSDDNEGCYIQDNYISVYPATSSNIDIIKVTGGTSNAIITGNFVKNNNVAAGAQVDVYTGAHKMTFANNKLYGVQLHRKHLTPTTKYSNDIITGNVFHMPSGYTYGTSIYYIGYLSIITNNHFINNVSANAGFGIEMDHSDFIYDSDFDTDAVSAVIVANNIFDFRGANSSSYPLAIDDNTLGANNPQFLNIGVNTLIGATRYLSGGAYVNSTLMDNVWGLSSGAVGTSFNSGTGNMALGNVADSAAATMSGVTSANNVNQSIPTLAAGATITLGSSSVYFINSGTDITDISGGYIGQTITLITAGTTTVKHNSSKILLSGGVDFVMNNLRMTLTLIKKSSTVWTEIARSA